MPTRNQIPPLLEPYWTLPPELSLILLTGTLGCSPTWLTTRFIGSVLAPQDESSTTESPPANAVLLVSWMQPQEFWKTEIRRATGLDTTKLTSQTRFAFLPLLSTPSPSTSNNPIESLSPAIAEATHLLQPNRITLILDHPDVSLATASTTSHHLSNLIIDLRKLVHAVVVTCSADLPFLAAAQGALTQNPTAPLTPLEAETAAFVVQQAHNARFVLSCRGLATGAAKDVSGVVRVTRGGAAYAYDGEGGGGAGRVAGMEALYLVSKDGNARVFQRGAEGG